MKRRGSEGREQGKYFSFLKDIDVSPEWESAADECEKRGGVVMVMGGTDTGKSTLCRYLVYYLYSRGHVAALVDLDLGQSHLGPPACLGWGLFPPLYPGDDILFPTGLYFIGRTSPVGVFLEVVVGCRTLVDEAWRWGASHVVVNTCGFIQGSAACRLKRGKVEVLRPRLVLGVERQGELGQLLLALVGDDAGGYLRLPVSERARLRSQEERRTYREGRWRRYFRQGQQLTLGFTAFRWQGLPWGLGQALTTAELRHYQGRLASRVLYGEADGGETFLILAQPPAKDLSGLGEERVRWVSWPSLSFSLTGLLDRNHRTLALGLILPSPWEEQQLSVWTPLPASAAREVRFVRLGTMKVNPEGRELAAEL